MKAPEGELVLQLFGGYDYPASALYPIVNTKYAHLFNVNMVQLMSKLTLSPEFRADIEHKILAILGDCIGENFNSEVYPKL